MRQFFILKGGEMTTAGSGDASDYKRRRVGFKTDPDDAPRTGEYSTTQVGFNREGRWARRAPTKGESLYGEHAFGFDVKAA